MSAIAVLLVFDYDNQQSREYSAEKLSAQRLTSETRVIRTLRTAKQEHLYPQQL